MYMIWVVVVFSMLAGAFALLDSESAPATAAPSEMNLALNFADYRQAVVTYAIANPAFVGDVPANSLQMGSGTIDSSWRNYVMPNTGLGYGGSEIVVYSVSTNQASLAGDIEQLAQGSAFAGLASSGDIVSPGNPAVPLPAGVAANVPNGSLVWMAQAYQP